MGLEQIELREVETLIPYARNARTHSDEQVAQLAASIREWGWTNPVLIAADGTIVAGHGRVMAARKLGIEDVPCLVVGRDWSDAKRRAYTIADNRLAESAGWDMDLLRLELQEIGAEFDVGLIGFEPEEMEDLLGGESPVRNGLIDDDEVPEAEEEGPYVSRLGDVWILGRHRLMVGDATAAADVDRLMDDELADLVWTDPPYNVAIEGKAGTIMNDDMSDAAFRSFLGALMANYARVMRDGAVIYVAHADSQRIAFTQALLDAGLKFSQVLIWVKHSATLSRQDYNWQHEPILYGWKEGAGHYFCGDFTKTTVIDAAANVATMTKAELSELVTKLLEGLKPTVIRHDRPTVSDLHPTMKPVALVQELIENSSVEGQLVLDLCGGSGSTLIAAEKSNRVCNMLELDPKYADVIVKRWQAFTGREALLERDGRSFSEIERTRCGTESLATDA